mmetsp:Transcript_4065/g.7596  ORF Transcript_4065/g.7596 Transcript_4065/m.7596 type:complete len:137 (+) Transcript_4065:541-951(+)
MLALVEKQREATTESRKAQAELNKQVRWLTARDGEWQRRSRAWERERSDLLGRIERRGGGQVDTTPPPPSSASNSVTSAEHQHHRHYPQQRQQQQQQYQQQHQHHHHAIKEISGAMPAHPLGHEKENFDDRGFQRS